MQDSRARASDDEPAGDERPRERLGALGPEALSESELLALVLRTGSGSRNVQALARAMLAQSGGLRSLCQTPLTALCELPGLGPAKAGSLVAAIEIGRRIASRRLRRGDPIRSPADVHAHFHHRLREQRREHFMVLLLDGRHRVMSESQVSQGTLTASLVHPREVFRPAIRAAAAAMVLVHNHPSGDPTPSEQDLEVTRRLVSAGEILGIRIMDHVVVAEQGYYSLQENGQLG